MASLITSHLIHSYLQINLQTIQGIFRGGKYCNVQINGVNHTFCPVRTTGKIKLATPPYCDINGEILYRQLWDETVIQDGDILEVVTIVGGG